MTTSKKSKAPTDPQTWVPWADDIIAQAQARLDEYRRATDMVKDYLAAPGGGKRPDADGQLTDYYNMRHIVGMLERVSNSYNTIMKEHDAAAVKKRIASAASFAKGDIVRLVSQDELKALRVSGPHITFTLNLTPGEWNALKKLYPRGLLKTDYFGRLEAIYSQIQFEREVDVLARKNTPEEVYWQIEDDDKRCRAMDDWNNKKYAAEIEAHRTLVEKYRPIWESLNMQCPYDVPAGTAPAFRETGYDRHEFRGGDMTFPAPYCSDKPSHDVHLTVVDVHKNAVLIADEGGYWVVRRDVLEYSGM